jgi:translation initiation factor 3 subunit J
MENGDSISITFSHQGGDGIKKYKTLSHLVFECDFICFTLRRLLDTSTVYATVIIMADNWDDDEDEWDVDDDALDQKLGLKKVQENLPTFDDEEDLALKEKAARDEEELVELKKKGTALAAKKQAEKDRLTELEIARKAMELEAEVEAQLTSDELRLLKRQQVEEADHALTNDLFGGGAKSATSEGNEAGSGGDTLVLKDVKDHLRHARKVADALKKHSKVHLTATFLKECIEQSASVLDDAAITDIIKTCNVIKNQKVQEAKRKVKGQAQKSKKGDKEAELKAKKIQVETFGDNDKFDRYDAIGEQYEDDFF